MDVLGVFGLLSAANSGVIHSLTFAQWNTDSSKTLPSGTTFVIIFPCNPGKGDTTVVCSIGANVSVSISGTIYTVSFSTGRVLGGLSVITKASIAYGK